MKSKADITAQRLVNLYRQAHVIVGGWRTLNPVFLQEATPEVLHSVANLPAGKNLVRHIENLRNGTTDMSTIDNDLLPYGGLMTKQSDDIISVSKSQLAEIRELIEKFTPDKRGLELLEQSLLVQQMGDNWVKQISKALESDSELLEKWHLVEQTYNAYTLWDKAVSIIEQPITDRLRANIQSDLLDYETYLPMFGDVGQELLTKLRSAIRGKKRRDE